MTPLALSAWRTGTRAVGMVVPERVLAPQPSPGRAAAVLVHAASAGEVVAARSLHAVARRLGAPDWLLTTGTQAGLTMGAEARLCRDVPRLVARTFDVVRPQAVLLIEAELWPNLLLEAERRGVPVGVIGATMSATTADRFRRHRAAGTRLLRAIRGFAAASSEDAERLLGAGAAPDAVQVTGWVKWPDSEPARPDRASQGVLAELSGAGPLVVLGSVHPGEVVLAASLLASTPLAPSRSRWLVCPRHAKAVAPLRAEANRTLGAGGAWHIDERFGGLNQWYRSADYVVVGGGGTGRGTHNLLEPLANGRRPLFFTERGAERWAPLVARGVATPMGEGETLADVLREPGEPWAATLSALDGRERGLEFLTDRGVSLT